MKIFLLISAISGFLSVALGAFGAHLLEGRIPDKYIETWQTGVQYQMFHTIAIVTVALLMIKLPNVGMLHTSGWLFLVGIILFSGSLYVLSLTQIGVLGAITPLGGVSFLAGWVLVAIVALKHL
ncbi:DUF423 domain-containing protein [Bacillus sp. HMF5848]|uniref:DUF423 domain-containing protein n=1 Tax=Bacillus sp. HMF5848 TaxID=2495421 RepID=UPI000F7AF119|nr:DUF423 domain-containing protein [Bacillus sp. HMF5848]RSK29004.1 DUF423 domain-containing protein [Bacillus sp. HMF5848]